MSYTYLILGDTPVGLWSMDAQSAGLYTDQSGYGSSATIVGGMATVKPIVAQGVGAQMMTGSGFTLPINTLMIQGAESKPFSYEFWFKHQNISGSGTFFKRNNSGITISGSTITASVQMSTTISASYTGLLVGEIYHCVVEYDGAHLSLYLNNSRVASAVVNPADLAASFTDVASTLSFSATGGYSVVLDSVAIYNYALSESQIDDHYVKGTDYPNAVRISAYNDSHQWRIWDGNATVLIDSIAKTAQDWVLGTFTGNAVVIGDTLANSWSGTTNQYEAGTWTMPLTITPTTGSTAASRITWDSNAAITVQVSTNKGQTWTTVTNGSDPLGVVSLTTGIDLAVKVTLAAGATQKILRRLNFVVYTSKSITGTNASLPLALTEPAFLAEYDYEPASFSDNLGVNLTANTSRVVIPQDTVFGGYFAIEMLVKFTASTASKTILSGGSASITTDASGNWVSSGIAALYIDGASASLTSVLPVANVWHHVVAVFSTAQAAAFYVGNSSAGSAGYPMRVGYVAAHLATLSATTVQTMYNAWVGAITNRVTDTNIVTIHEHNLDGSGHPIRAYAYDWSVTGAG